MYDYNNMNDMNNTNGMNHHDTQSQQYQGSFSTEPRPPKKPNTHKTGRVIALIAAVAVLCGGAGFGGAFAANKAMSMVSGSSASDTTTSSDGSSADSQDSDSSLSSDAQEVIDALQSGVSGHTTSGNVEYNSDGTYTYTRDLVKAVKDSIVYIEVYVNYRGQETLYGAGSGIVISQDGYILTNAHVAENDTYPVSRLVVNVNTTDPNTGDSVSNSYDAELLGSDTDTDLAVLKIDAEGLETSVSKGVVSGLNRQVYDDNSVSAIQTDTAINSGNSGGGMFNMYGEVVGVVNMKLVNDNAENLGFAITINDAKTVISDLITKGYVTGRPILGITCLQVSDYLGAIQGMTPGLLVTDIDKSLAIANSELVVGDTITAINGTEVRSVDEVSEVIKDMKPGDTAAAATRP